ncbi:hypothetical protein B0J14DRAFT_598896 [Halenospora varia]|nr:hypothetical protein B0J14DRAFT_598896 [Halenospora varia]
MRSLSVILISFAVFTAAQLNLPFDTIYSVHTTGGDFCPPDYQADSKYIACCSKYATLTTAKGPGGTALPACCNPDAVLGCTGAPKLMQEWSISTNSILGTTVLATTGATTAKASTTVSPGQSPVSVPTTTVTGSTTNNNQNNNNINVNSGACQLLQSVNIVSLLGAILCALVMVING